MTRVLRACALLALVACGGTPPPASSVVGNESGPTPAPLSPRDALIAQLHTSEQVMVLDFSLLPIATYLQAITDAFPCTVPLIAAKPLVILGGDTGVRREGIISHLDAATTTDCIAQIAPLAGFEIDRTDGELRVTAGPTTYRLRWNNRLLHVTAVGTEPTGSISPELMARIAKIPTDAGFWMISSGYPEFQIARSHLWIRIEATHLIVESVAEGTAPGAAAKWLGGIEAGFRSGFANVGIELPAEPFGEITDDGISARLDARVPLSLFRPAGAP